MKLFKRGFLFLAILISVFTLCSCQEFYDLAFEKDITKECLVHSLVVSKEVKSTCYSEGYIIYKCSKCGYTTDREYQPLLDHTPEDPECYCMYQHCTVCNNIFKLEPEVHLEEEVEYTLTEEFVDEVVGKFDECVRLVEENASITDPAEREAFAEQVDDLFGEAMDGLTEIVQQYYIASLLFYVDTEDEENSDNYQQIQELYNDVYNVYQVSLYKLFYSDYQTELFGDDPEELAEWAEELQYFKDDELGRIRSEIDDLEYAITYEDLTEEELVSAVYELIDLRNDLAKRNGYDNYYEYACYEVYTRDYGNDMISTFRELCKENLFEVMMQVYWPYSYYYNLVSDEDREFVTGLSNGNALDNTDNYNKVFEYLKLIKNDQYGVDMYACINDAFKRGDMVFATNENAQSAAYTQTGLKDHMYCYFQVDDYYSAPLTLVHEFGHLNAGKADVHDMDLMEIQSQGNESLFKAYMTQYLSNNEKSRDVSFFDAYNTVNDIYSTIISLVVDEFEYSLYVNYNDNDPMFEDGISYEEWGPLMESIEHEYTSGKYSIYSFLGPYAASGMDGQWLYYFAQRSCYEVSYAISYIPTLELYIDACTDFEDAKLEYVKAVSYQNTMEYLEDGHLISVLEFAGLSNPFEQAVYDKFKSFFVTTIDEAYVKAH